MDKCYSIFCIASQLLKGRERELDLVWEDATKLYEDFLVSGFNNLNESELECINEFINNLKIN